MSAWTTSTPGYFEESICLDLELLHWRRSFLNDLRRWGIKADDCLPEAHVMRMRSLLKSGMLSKLGLTAAEYDVVV